jgi:hypothetical protein
MTSQTSQTSQTSKKDNCANYSIGFITFLLGIAVFVLIGLPLMLYGSYDIYECDVINVEYPTILPSNNDTSNWIGCDCGRYCKAWTPCIDVYVSINNNNNNSNSNNSTNNLKIYRALDNFMSRDTTCTFYDSQCKNGEDIIQTKEKLAESIEKAQSYINKTVTCYADNNINNINNVYLDRSINIQLMIVIGSFFIIFLGILIARLCCNCC